MAGFLLLVAFYQLSTPIRMGDTDMWYHLNGGRHLFNTGEMTSQPFFSVLDGVREWVVYYWGFQALSYGLFEAGGYQALVIFRALSLVAAGVLVFLYLSSARRREDSWLFPALAGALLIAFLDGRFLQVRPHIATYLLLLTFLYVLEFRPRWTPVLPLLATAWANLHGVTYVLGVLVCGAYFLEFLVGRLRGQPGERTTWRFGLGILLCAPAVLINPNGIGILSASFAIPPNIDQFISELKALSPVHFTTLFLSNMQLAQGSLLMLVAGGTLYAALQSVQERRVRLAHWLLALGGAALLPRGHRFLFEWIILSLPLLATVHAPALPRPARPLALRHGLVLFALALPVGNFAKGIDRAAPYPFDPQGLPVGITEFMAQEGLQGNFLTPPSEAGYVQWRLYPDVRIFMDMEFPPFTAEDFLRLASAYRSADGFRLLDQQYRFDFVSVARSSGTFKKVAEELGDLKPIWFDDAQVLFVNTKRRPELAQRHALEAIDPFSLLEGPGSTAEKVATLQRLHAAQPQTERTLHALARLALEQKDYAAALGYAEQFLAVAPTNPNSHYLVGDALENLGRYDEAVPHYQRALDHADADFRSRVQLHLGTCYYQLQDFAAAYRAFSAGLQPFTRIESAEDLFQGAFAAAYAGDLDLTRLWVLALSNDWTQDQPELVAKGLALLDDLEGTPQSPWINLKAWIRHLSGAGA
jgi:tetratricopeptide (TPR) repeat protein